MTESGIEHTDSDHAKMRRRSRLVTSVAIIQKNTSALMYWSVRTATLPLGQYDSGIVNTVQPRSAMVRPASTPDGMIGWRRTVESIACAAMATPAASSAIRTVFSTGKNVCGDSSKMTVNTTRPPNANDLPVSLASTVSVASTSGRHQIAPALISAIARLRDASLFPGHAHRAAEHLHLVEACVLIPT